MWFQRDMCRSGFQRLLHGSHFLVSFTQSAFHRIWSASMLYHFHCVFLLPPYVSTPSTSRHGNRGPNNQPLASTADQASPEGTIFDYFMKYLRAIRATITQETPLTMTVVSSREIASSRSTSDPVPRARILCSYSKACSKASATILSVPSSTAASEVVRWARADCPKTTWTAGACYCTEQ